MMEFIHYAAAHLDQLAGGIIPHRVRLEVLKPHVDDGLQHCAHAQAERFDIGGAQGS